MAADTDGHAACPQQERTAALAAGELDDAARRAAQEHLERCAACRAHFREGTAGRFPEFPNYTILEQIGKGGFGVVYKAVHHAKEHIEALKVLFNKTPVMTSYFENEVHLIARLRHENIALLYDAQLTTAPLYYAMEYIDGVRLNDYLRETEASLTERIELVRTVALAVDYAHRKGVVHRDIKPQNVLIDGSGAPRLVDFGIAQRLEELAEDAGTRSLRSDHPPVGTIGYIAPEQIRHGRCDSRADIFSLGALLFHAITGEPARLARDPAERARALHARKASRAEDLGGIIGRCVAEDPEQRYPTCEALARDLDNYLAGRPIEGRRDRPWWYAVARIGAYVMRRHAMAVRAALIVALAGVLTTEYYTLGARTTATGPVGEKTRIVSVGEATHEAIMAGHFDETLPELTIGDRQSQRLLYAHFMQKLAVARPLAVTWDYYFPECRPEYDEAFIAALAACPAPVIVGVERYDLNGEPELCPEIRAAVDGWGWLIANRPQYQSKEYEVPFAIERGFYPQPSLAVATFGAARYRQYLPRYRLHADRRELEVRYERRDPGEDEARWLRDTDRLPLMNVRRASADASAQAPQVNEGDVVGHGRAPAKPKAFWDDRTIEMIDVLSASDAQVRDWFDGRVVLIGQQFRSWDLWINGLGEQIYGVQVHADVINSLMSHVFVAPFTRSELAPRALVWSCLAGLMVTLAPSPGRRNATPVLLACLAVLLIGQWLTLASAIWEFHPLTLETFFGLGVLLTTTAVLAAVRAIGEQKLALDPATRRTAADEPTLGTTVLAETT